MYSINSESTFKNVYLDPHFHGESREARYFELALERHQRTVLELGAVAWRPIHLQGQICRAVYWEWAGAGVWPVAWAEGWRMRASTGVRLIPQAFISVLASAGTCVGRARRVAGVVFEAVNTVLGALRWQVARSWTQILKSQRPNIVTAERHQRVLLRICARLASARGSIGRAQRRFLPTLSSVRANAASMKQMSPG